MTVLVPHTQKRSAELAASKNNGTPVERNKSISYLTGIKREKSLEFEIEDIMSADECEKDGPMEEITVGPTSKNSSADIDVNSDPTDLATEFNEMRRSCLMIVHQTSAHPRYKPYACDVCKRSFAQKDCLNKHMKTHTRRTPYACCYCGMKFSWKYSLKSHERIHYRIKTYTCYFCDMRFSGKTALNLHKKIHYNENPYTCDVCMKQFVYKAQLNRHNKRKCSVDQHRQTYIYSDEIPSVTVFAPHMQKRSAEIAASNKNDTPVERNKSLSDLTGIMVDTCLEFEIEDIMSADECEKDGPAEEITVKPGKNSTADIDVNSGPTDLATEFNEMKRSCLMTSAHPGYKPFACVVCKRSFKQKDRLNKHMRTHTRRTPYACCYCGMKFSWKNSLKWHERIHFREKPYACCFCDMRFSGKTAQNLHKRIHYNENPYTCDVCMKQFVYKAQLNRHNKKKCFVDQHRQTYIYSDEIPSVTVFVPHMQKRSAEIAASKNSGTPVERNESLSYLTGIKGESSLEFEFEDIMSAVECEKDDPAKEVTMKPGKNSSANIDVNSDLTNLATEFNETKRSCLMTSAHPGYKPFACDVCKRSFTQKDRLNKHMRTHTRRTPYACCYCGMKFSWKYSLKSHERIHYRIKTYTCYFCDMRFSGKTALNLHKKIHYNENPYTCDVCMKQFVYKAQLSRHNKRKCSVDQHRQTYICSDEIPSVTVFAPHMQKRSAEIAASNKNDTPVERNKSLPDLTGIKVEKSLEFEIEDIMSADECEKDGPAEEITVKPGKNSTADIDVNSDPTDLATEFSETKRSCLMTSAHPGYKPFACDVCKRSFTQKDRLNKHMRTHTRRTPYACCYCGMKFSWKNSLKWHERIHFREKPHACCFCDMRFSGKTALNLHKKIHYNENPYTCDVCMKQFVYKAQLNRHNKRKCFFDQHRQSRTEEIPSATVGVPVQQKK